MEEKDSWKKAIKGARILWRQDRKQFLCEILPAIAMWALLAYLAVVIVSEAVSGVITQTLTPDDLCIIGVGALVWVLYAGFCSLPTLLLYDSLNNLAEWHEK